MRGGTWNMTLTIDSLKMIGIGNFVVNYLQCVLINYIFFKKKCKPRLISVLGSMTYIFFILCMGIIGNSIVYSVIIMILFNITIEGNLKDRILITLKVYLINICLGYITQMLICIICNIRISSLQNGDWLKGYSILLLILFIIAFIKKVIW